MAHEKFQSQGLTRYPGGKGKLSPEIGLLLQDCARLHGLDKYVEVFCGGGAIVAEILGKRKMFKNMVINDLDWGIYSIWHSVIHQPEQLIAAVHEFTPSAAAFFKFRESLRRGGRDEDPVTTAFQKIAVHQMSHRGKGTKAGLMGGKDQKNEQVNAASRWNPKGLEKKIRWFSSRLTNSGATVTSEEFSTVINAADDRSLIYLDPPYVGEGDGLYQHSMSLPDHMRLCEDLKSTKGKWVLSYDDCELVRRLYRFANIDTIKNLSTLSISKGKSKMTTELIITNF